MNRYFSSSKRDLLQRTAILLLVLYLPFAKSKGSQGDNMGKVCQFYPTECLDKVNSELKGVK